MNDFVLNYEPWLGNNSRCRVRTYKLGQDTLTVIIITELPDNPGMSVTNAAEIIATQLTRHHNVDPHRTLWIEHYPNRHPTGMESDPTFDETYDLITFEWNGCMASCPRWCRVSQRWIDELIEPKSNERGEQWASTFLPVTS